MCVRVTCTSCGKPTYAGCGAHVEQVLLGIPPEQRCHSREESGKAKKRSWWPW
jgi:hypothetical protein